MTVWTVAIETVATAGSVALLQDDQLHAEQALPADSRSAKTLAAAVRQIWQQAGKPTIGLVAVAKGPGSFTGLRVGVITAKTLAYAWQAHLIGIHTLDAIAAQTPVFAKPPVPSQLHVILDAQRQELFVARYQALADKSWQRQTADAIVSTSDFLAQLQADTAATSLQVTGPALAKLSNQLPTPIQLTEPSLWQPTARSVAQLARQAHQAGSSNELFTLTPHYLRPSYAEEKKVKI